jgi:hypothetical protein
MPVENRPCKAPFRRALGLNEGASQSPRGVARSKCEAHHWAKTCRRCRTDEIEAGNRRFEVPCLGLGPVYTRQYSFAKTGSEGSNGSGQHEIRSLR